MALSKEKSVKEQRVRNVTSLYYSKPEVQKAIFDFSKGREIVPRYFEGFGKRPDNFQYEFLIGDETIYSETGITDIEKKSATLYRNNLLGDSDLYVGVDLTFLAELALLEDTREDNLFKYGVRVGKAILRGDIKIKPVWKFYKMLSAMEAIDERISDFSEGIASSLT